MAEDLEGEALELGGQVSPIQGSIYVRIPAKGATHKFWIVSFYFYSFDELKRLGKMCIEKGYQPFTDVIDLKVSGTDVILPRQEDGPSCPYHGDEFVAKSTKRPGTLYCKAKLKDGSYCKWQT